MEKTYLKLNTKTPPVELSAKIISCVRVSEQKRERNRAIIFSCVAFTSLAVAIPSFESVGAKAAQSGFTGYAQLVFSDWGTVASLWKVFALSLVETAPLFAIAISAAVLFVFMWSTSEAFRYTRAAKMALS